MIQTISRARARLSAAMLGGLIALSVTTPAHAAGSSMPWEAPLQSIQSSCAASGASARASFKKLLTIRAMWSRVLCDRARTRVSVRRQKVLEKHSLITTSRSRLSLAR